jgi:RNA polymerase sigma-70 factor (ECF subfamily)
VPQADDDDVRLLEALRAGDEAAFEELVSRHGASLLRVARQYTPSHAVAEEVVQETWLGVLRGLERFEGRSSLRTWLFTIVSNRARTRGVQEHRSVPFAALAGQEVATDEAAVDADRFTTDGAWASPPRRWEENPERSLQSGETVAVIERAIELLPDTQRLVITMRDVEGWPADEVRNALRISETNQRVLLHRARSKVRRALEEYFADDPAP